jgi:hypothetical protein
MNEEGKPGYTKTNNIKQKTDRNLRRPITARA